MTNVRKDNRLQDMSFEKVFTYQKSGQIAYRAKDLPSELLRYVLPFAVLQTPPSEAMPSSVEAVRINNQHKRSVLLELPWDAIEYHGKLYKDISVKGADEENIHLYWDKSLKVFKVYGLLGKTQEGLQAITQDIQLALLTGDETVETEDAVFMYKPDHIYYQGKKITQLELKKQLLDNVRQTETSTPLKGHDVVTVDSSRIDEVEEYFRGKDFYLMFRLQPIGLRVLDFEMCKTKEAFLEELAQVFKFVNIRELHEQRKDPTYIANLWYLHKDYGEKGRRISWEREINEMTGEYEDVSFDVDKETQEKIDKFFVEYLAKEDGKNMGKLHKKGLKHGSVHAGNIFATGGFGDNDSLKGELLQKGTIENYEMASEIHSHFVTGPADTISDLQKIGFLSKGKDLAREYNQNFLESYFSSLLGENWLQRITPDDMLEARDIKAVVYNPRVVMQGSIACLAHSIDNSIRNELPSTSYQYSFHADMEQTARDLIYEYAKRVLDLAEKRKQENYKEFLSKRLNALLNEKTGSLNAWFTDLLLKFLRKQISADLTKQIGEIENDHLKELLIQRESFRFVTDLYENHLNKITELFIEHKKALTESF